MLQKTKGIVLHSIKQGESGRIARIYTLDYGLLTCFVRSTKTKKRNSAGLYQALMILEMEVDIRESRNLQTLRNASALPQGSLRYMDPSRTCIALFMAELFLSCLEENESSSDLFSWLITWIEILESRSQLAELSIDFCLALSRPLGFFPDLSTSGKYFDLREGTFCHNLPRHPDFVEGEIIAYLRSLHGMDLVTREASRVDKKTRRMTLDMLMRYYLIHVPGFRKMNSLAILQEVFES